MRGGIPDDGREEGGEEKKRKVKRELSLNVKKKKVKECEKKK